MMALADESELGSPEIFALFSHRLPTDLDPIELRATLRALLDAPSGLLGVVPAPLRTIVREHFNEFVRQMPEDFDLRGASMGNLLLAGTYLSSSRDIDAVVLLFERLVLVRGLVLPVVDADLELAAELDDGTILLGQHLLTGKEVPPLSRPITRLWLARSLDDHSRAEISASNRVIKLIEGAELICFPMGSFFSSLIATLLPTGVGAAIARAPCPKVFIPSTGADPERLGHSVSSCVEILLRVLREDAGSVKTEALLNGIVLDSSDQCYLESNILDSLERFRVPVFRHNLVRSGRADIDAEQLVPMLLSWEDRA
jgi:CofD-related protein of GAK system